MAIMIRPPYKIMESVNTNSIKIFTAGTIDQGLVEPWADKVFEFFHNKYPYINNGITIINPRRTEWDSSWEQTYENPQFYQQVNWELNGLEQSNFIIINILPDSKSPITLLELGLFAKSGNVLVCCPQGFYRKGNVDVVCERYGVPIYNNLEELLVELNKRIIKQINK